MRHEDVHSLARDALASVMVRLLILTALRNVGSQLRACACVSNWLG